MSGAPLLIAGGGIGGLAAAIAASRAGWSVQVHEQSATFPEVGAGLQLGPNAVRALRALGALPRVQAFAAFPSRIAARDATSGRELASLPLSDFESRYGAPYLTLHRADLHAQLLELAREQGVALHSGARVGSVQALPGQVRAQADGRPPLEAAALVGADGLWSSVRGFLLADGTPRASSHVAYRGLVPIAQVPRELRGAVMAWLAPAMHAVTYPVRGGDALNIVCVVEEPVAGERSGWDLPAAQPRVHRALAAACADLRALAAAVPRWGLWVLHDRAPVRAAHEMARGRIALLGDAAHPMRPYLAQGAAMALEDALQLGHVLRDCGAAEVEPALQHYAQARWQRCARVQRRSLRNGAIFHARGGVRLARDLSLRMAGMRLMDVPWLYGAAAGG